MSRTDSWSGKRKATPNLRDERLELQLRQAIVDCGRICHDRNLMPATDGNISARLPDGRILITPAGVAKGRLSTDGLVMVDHDGAVIDSGDSAHPSSEMPMHLEVYRSRPEMWAVIHAHPVFATALTVAGLPFPSDVLPEILLLLGDVPVTEFAAPSSTEDAEAIRPFIGDHAAILLRQHGALTVGRDLEEALQHMERIEHVAEVFWRARMLGHVEHLGPEMRERLRAQRSARPGT